MVGEGVGGDCEYTGGAVVMVGTLLVFGRERGVGGRWVGGGTLYMMRPKHIKTNKHNRYMRCA